METVQKLPIRISESDVRLLLVTPMPGIKPPDISITITGRFVKISGRQTGLGQDDKNLLIEEWNNRALLPGGSVDETCERVVN